MELAWNCPRPVLTCPVLSCACPVRVLSSSCPGLVLHRSPPESGKLVHPSCTSHPEKTKSTTHHTTPTTQNTLSIARTCVLSRPHKSLSRSPHSHNPTIPQPFHTKFPLFCRYHRSRHLSSLQQYLCFVSFVPPLFLPLSFCADFCMGEKKGLSRIEKCWMPAAHKILAPIPGLFE